MANLDAKTIASFGDEWGRFDQTGMKSTELDKVFVEYFAVFPWEQLPEGAIGFDMGCGSGRWARLVAPRVGWLHCIDPSPAIEVARRTLAGCDNVSFHRASTDDPGLPRGSQDFGYSLGVLHHVPDTARAMRSCVDLLKPGGVLLVYLYYAFDDRPGWFRALWRLSDLGRRAICRLPPRGKRWVTDLIAALVYLPLARGCELLERVGVGVDNIPLAYYRHHSFYTLRTDARDRFGTPLEKRFTRREVVSLMEGAGLERIRVSDTAPFWCAVGFKRQLAQLPQLDPRSSCGSWAKAESETG